MNNQICKTCVMDQTAPEVKFNHDGICNYCLDYDKIRLDIDKNIAHKDKYFSDLVKKLKANQKGPYDSLLALSGGGDSSYICLLAKELGLNPLLIHFDNGWNSEIAVSNIKKLAKYTGFDLQTYVINWPEFRDLQRAFIKAGVLDIEMLTDHAILATMLNFSKKYKVRTVLSGNNLLTEFGLPKSWSWNKKDLRNILDIHKKFGDLPLKTFPRITTLKWILIQRFNLGLTYLEPLNHMPYRKNDAIKELEQKVGWVYYGGKHYESVFTKFYQAYILPLKFHIDKRKAHLSGLIRNKEITRAEALAELEKPLYPEKDLCADKEYVLKKLGFSEQEFDAIMAKPPVSHREFKTDEKFVEMLIRLKRCFS